MLVLSSELKKKIWDLFLRKLNILEILKTNHVYIYKNNRNFNNLNSKTLIILKAKNLKRHHSRVKINL
jgi:hypothetical protein